MSATKNSFENLKVKWRKSNGFSLAEVLIAMTLFLIFTLGVVVLSMDAVDRGVQQKVRQEALHYVMEGQEAVRSMRDRNFFLLTNGDHGLTFENDQWSFIAAPEDIDGFFERTVTIHDVYRNSYGEISDPESGTFDPETKKINVQVDWLWRGTVPQSLTMDTYLTNWTGDDWIQTTCTEWTAGFFDNTEAVETPAPPTDNCALTLTLLEEASTFFESADIGEHGNDVVVDGSYAYVASAKSNEGLAIVDVSDPENPVIVHKVDVGGKGRYVTKEGNYVYVSVESSKKGLVIVDVSNPATAYKVSELNIGAAGNQSVVSGNYLFMGAEDDNGGFVVINISNKSAPSVVKKLDIDTKARSLALNGSYVYAGVTDDTFGFRVINVSNPSAPAQVATLNVGEEVNAVEVNGAVAYLGIEDADQSLQVISIADSLNPQWLASVDVQGEIQDLVVGEGGDYLYAAIDDNQAGLGALNITTPSAPYVVYNVDTTGKATGIDNLGGYLYLTIDVNNRGLVILGATVAGTQTSGTFVSVGFDTGSDSTRYNFIEWDHTEVAGGSVKLRLRTADSEAGLATATWVGSDGTSGTTYENSRTEIVLDPNRSGQRYFQFQVMIESDGVTTPTVESVRLNYTP